MAFAFEQRIEGLRMNCGGNGADLARTMGLNLGDAFVFTGVGVLLTLSGIAGIGWKVTR